MNDLSNIIHFDPFLSEVDLVNACGKKKKCCKKYKRKGKHCGGCPKR
ncbi:hypothetical protein K6119_01375 [Paracrocinitomix mangrovi]|nr:hypothetical protein [Paracrocinitomix mangrovi]UKN02167.1 hypothetical protein K6119_01375 [Paracrocinitomix mangrovi]